MGKGSLKIQLDKPYFLAGETMSGRVTMTINHSGLKGSELKLKLKGVEKTFVEHTVHDSDDHYTEIFEEKKQF